MLTVEQLLKTARHDVRKTQKAYDNNYNKPHCPLNEQENLKKNLEYRKFVLRLVESYVRALDRKKEQSNVD